MVAGLKEVRDRIASVKNTQKITDAMKLVAAAKVRRAQEAVVNGRPFSENLVKVRGGAGVAQFGPLARSMSRRWAIAAAPKQDDLYRFPKHFGLGFNGAVSVAQVLYGVNQRVRQEDVDSPLCAVRPVKSVLLVVLTGDRGLCGGYNNFIIKKVRSASTTFLGHEYTHWRRG